VTRVFAAPRDLVWALVADTNRWDRASGLTPGRYEWREVDGTRQRTATAREMGFTIEWVEPPYQWVEGRYIHGERTFLSGPVRRGGFRARLDDVEGGTEVRATAYVGGANALLGAVMKGRFRRALRRYFDAIEDALERAGEEEVQSPAPAVTRIQRALMAGYDPVTSGVRTEPDLDVLTTRMRALRDSGVGDRVAEKIESLLRERPDEEVSQIRPLELARIWDADRRDVLRAFLLATRAGLVDLRWQINCPVCRVSADVVGALEDVRNQVHCEACHISYDVDFAKHVEAVFQSNPAIRTVQSAVYCASSPSFRPHVFAQLTLEPGEAREETCELPAGSLHLRSLLGPRTGDVDVSRDGAGLSATLRDREIQVGAGSQEPARARIRIENPREERDVVLLERSGWSADAVLGSVVASFPDFLDLFATEAPASGVELSVGHLALLFSDLTGSTALYERVGDARAFAIVEEHFRIMERTVREHDGALVKTMGDAVMASFGAPARAIAAALEMVPACDEAHGELGIGVKLGVHAGPCLRIDFFGTTVNVAARLQAQAGGGELVVTEGLAADATVAPLVEGLSRRSFDAALKGIEQTQRLVGITVPGREDAASKAS